MSVRLHPTKNKHLNPGEDKWYQIESGHGKERVTYVQQLPSEHAARLLDNELKRVARPALTSAVAPSFDQILPDFLEWYKLHRQPRSLEAWLEGWNNLSPLFAKMKPNHISPSLIDQYKTHRLSQKAGKRSNLVSKRTVAKELANLSAIITYAVDRNLCEPLTFKIRGFSKKQTKPPAKVIPTPEKVQAMLEATRADVRPLYYLIYYAGLRSEEARTLKSKNVDLDLNVIRITGKGDKQRIVPIADQLRPILEKEMKGKKPDDILMLSHRTGKPYSRNIGRLDGAARQAGITSHVSCHTLRHCFGTHCVYWGMDLRTVQMLMGHSESTTTEIYTTLAATFLSQQMRRFGTSPNKSDKKPELKLIVTKKAIGF